ncbi:MAG: hypothetical protein ACP5O3_01195 [Candidatus Micrarchaeia archaeon]
MLCPKCGSREVEIIFTSGLSAVTCKCRECGFNGVVQETGKKDDYELFASKLRKARRGRG